MDRRIGRTDKLDGQRDGRMNKWKDWTDRQTGRSGLMDREDGQTSRWTEGRTDCTKGRTVQSGRMEWRELPDGRTDGQSGWTERTGGQRWTGRTEGGIGERTEGLNRLTKWTLSEWTGLLYFSLKRVFG